MENSDGIGTVSYTHLDVYKRQEEAVTREKQNKIRRSALFYLQKKGYNPEDVFFRFDVLAIRKEKGKLQFFYYPGSF